MQGGLHIGHDHRRADALPFHVGHHGHQRFRAHGNKIVIISAHFERRPVRNANIESGKLRRALGQQTESECFAPAPGRAPCAAWPAVRDGVAHFRWPAPRDRKALSRKCLIGGERAVLFIQQLQHADDFAVFIANRQAQQGASAVAEPAVHVALESRILIGIGADSQSRRDEPPSRQCPWWRAAEFLADRAPGRRATRFHRVLYPPERQCRGRRQYAGWRVAE